MKDKSENFHENPFSAILQNVQIKSAITSLNVFQGNLSIEENKKRNERLESMIMCAHYGYYKIIGHYAEDEHGEVKEANYLIVDMESRSKGLKQFALKVAKEFGLDSVFFRTPEHKGVMINAVTEKEHLLEGKFSVKKLPQIYAQIKGKPYVIDSVENYTNGALKFDAIKNGTHNELVEFWKYIYQSLDLEEVIVGISAFYGNLSLDENQKRSEKLAEVLWRAGYGHNKIICYHVDKEQNKILDETFFIRDRRENVEKLKDIAIKLGRFFEQDTIFFRTPKNGNKLIGCATGTEKAMLSEFSIDNINQFYSEIRDKDYALESIEDYVWPCRGYNGAMLRAKYDKISNWTYEDFVEQMKEID